MPALAAVLASVIVGCFGIWLSWYAKKKEQDKKDDLIVKTNPADPDGIADIDRLQRVQDDRNVPTLK